MILHDVALDEPTVRDFCQKWRIRELRVFGSILRVDFRPDSDVDVLVEFETGTIWGLFDLADAEEDSRRSPR